MKIIIKILNFPIPRYTFNLTFLKSLIICFIYDVCFVFIFEPNVKIGLEFEYSFPLFYAITVLSCGVITVYVSPYIFFTNKNWTILNEILFFILNLIISTFVLTVSYFCMYYDRFKLVIPFKLLFLAFFIGLFPSFFIILVKVLLEIKELGLNFKKLNEKYQNFKKNQYFNNSENKGINSENEVNSEIAVEIKGNNKKDTIKLYLNNLYLINSKDNYVNIYYKVEDKMIKRSQRNTLNNIYDQLDKVVFIKCHRAYIINHKKIEEIYGNKRSCKVKLKEIDFFIPVGISSFDKIKKLYKEK